MIASIFTRTGYPVGKSNESDNCRLMPSPRADKPNFSIAITELIAIFFACFTPETALKNASRPERKKLSAWNLKSLFYAGFDASAGKRYLTQAFMEKADF